MYSQFISSIRSFIVFQLAFGNFRLLVFLVNPSLISTGFRHSFIPPFLLIFSPNRVASGLIWYQCIATAVLYPDLPCPIHTLFGSNDAEDLAGSDVLATSPLQGGT